ncbi:MAG: fumarate hydratase [Eggerthellaceae bacterium]
MRALEEELLAAVNATGVGPGGLGGRTTALAVRVATAPCHIAALPLAINMGCSAMRRCTVDLASEEGLCHPERSAQRGVEGSRAASALSAAEEDGSVPLKCASGLAARMGSFGSAQDDKIEGVRRG